ncbi:MAG: hypothetical protein RL748_3485 [Pseudomonadota bacterium]|jgi:uncharacterized protein (DUF885 family)
MKQWASLVFSAVCSTALVNVSIAAESMKPNIEFRQTSNQFLQALWHADKDFSLAAGRYDAAGQLPIPDAASREQQRKFIQQWLGKVEAYQPEQLSKLQATDWVLLKNYLQGQRWYLDSLRQYEWDPSQYNIAGPIDQILNTHYGPKEQRLRTISQRLRLVPDYYQAAKQNIKQATREHTALAIQQNQGALQVLQTVLKEAQDSQLSEGDKRQLQKRVQTASQAVQAWGEWLKQMDQQPGERRSFRLGKELYEQKFAQEIQSSLSAEQLYQQAQEAKDTLLTKMNTLADELWPKYMAGVEKPSDRSAKIGQLIAKMSEKHVTRDQFVPEVKRQIPQLMDWVISHNLLTMDRSKPLEVRETPLYQRGVAGAGIEAPGPFRPKDRTYYNVSPLDDFTPEQAESSLREYNHWILQILNIHEAIPGHYTQLVYANRSPSLIKTLFGNGAMIEGWAVYGERMMMESGYGGNTPEMWLMYSKWNLRTVCNTILDYRVHVLGMEENDAVEFLTKEAFQTESEAKGKWRRVQLTSVQLTSYYSGFAEIMALREERKKALGDKFNLKAFNETLLSYGSAPVRMIRKLMN